MTIIVPGAVGRMLVVNPTLKIPLREFYFSFSRSPGPGGQNVNKVNTKATLRWSLARSTSLPEDIRDRFSQKFRRRITKNGDLVLSSSRFRDQGRNVADCLEKLRAMLDSVSTAPKIRKKRKPSGTAIQRRLDDKRRQSDKKRRRRTVDRDE